MTERLEVAIEVLLYLIQAVFSSRLVRCHAPVAITAITKRHRRANISQFFHGSRRFQRYGARSDSTFRAVAPNEIQRRTAGRPFKIDILKNLSNIL